MSVKKVLLVDDTELFLHLERTFLQRSGIEILTAGDGCQALELARMHSPGLVFLDLNMPKMDGDECCRTLKSDPTLKHIAVVMVTTKGRPQDVERCWKAGCDEILLKPINRTEFVATAQKYLQVPVRQERYKAEILVQYGKDAENRLTDFTIDISSGGLFVCTENPLDVDDSLSICFLLTNPNREISCHAQVAWVNSPMKLTKTTLPAGMGIRFNDLSLEDLHAIRDFIANNKFESTF